jgi:hypothetical protein
MLFDKLRHSGHMYETRVKPASLRRLSKASTVNVTGWGSGVAEDRRKMGDALGGDRLKPCAAALNKAAVGPTRDIGC